MKAFSTLAFFILLTAAVRGGPVETTIIAAMKLSDVPNYSWTTTVMDDARTYDIEGKAVREGFCWQRQPMPQSIARRLGGDRDHELEAVFKGPTQFVIHTGSGWKRLDELPRRHRDWVDEDAPFYVPVMLPPAINSGIDAPYDPSGFPSVVYVPVPRAKGKRPYSNFQFALSLPHEELAVIVSSFGNLAVDGDIATGTLSDLGAQLLLVHDGHEDIRPLVATGAFKLWSKDAVVVKYFVKLAGIVVFDKKQILVRQESSTVVKSIGTTTIEIAEEARRKLAR